MSHTSEKSRKLSVTQYAAEVGCNRNTILQRIKSGKLVGSAVKMGNSYIITAPENFAELEKANFAKVVNEENE